MGFRNYKRSAYTNKEGLWVSCDGTTIKDRKPDLKLKPNHFRTEPVIHWLKKMEKTIKDN